MLFQALMLACTGSGDVSSPAEEVATSVVEDSLVDASWQVEIAPAEALSPLSGSPVWQSFFKREYAQGLSVAGEGPAAARIHAEIAAMYRQALLIQAYSIIETYKEDQRREGDPAEVGYLVGVSYVVTGASDKGPELIKAAESSAYAPVAAAAKAWSARLADEAGWLSLSSDAALFPLPEVQVGGMPELPADFHYEIAETIGDQSVKLSDPTALLQAALWHEQASIQAGSPELTSALLAPWRLPTEDVAVLSPDSLPIEALFMGIWSTEADLAYVGALGTSEDPNAVLAKYTASSPYAALSASCLRDGALEAACVQDGAIKLARQYEARMSAAAGGPSADHRLFLDHVRTGALQAASRLSWDLGEERVAGGLRLNARDRAIEAAADPVFLLSFAAWDARQRNPQRALDLFHGYVDALPGLQAARVSIDALQLRVQRDSGPGIPAL